MTNRQEVAEKLRRIEEDIDYETAFMEIDTIIGTKDNYSFSFFFNRLADLIDPVCHAVVDLESDGIGAPYRYTSRCSNCGQVWGEAIYFPHVPIYCPACGARVVRDDL